MSLSLWLLPQTRKNIVLLLWNKKHKFNDYSFCIFLSEKIFHSKCTIYNSDITFTCNRFSLSGTHRNFTHWPVLRRGIQWHQLSTEQANHPGNIQANLPSGDQIKFTITQLFCYPHVTVTWKRIQLTFPKTIGQKWAKPRGNRGRKDTVSPLLGQNPVQNLLYWTNWLKNTQECR